MGQPQLNYRHLILLILLFFLALVFYFQLILMLFRSLVLNSSISFETFRVLDISIYTFIGLFVLIKISIFVSTALESAFPYINSSSYFYAVPFAVGAMLVRIVLNSEVAIFFSVLVAMLVGIDPERAALLDEYA